MKKHPLIQGVQTLLFFATWIFIAWFLYKNAGSVQQVLQVKNWTFLLLAFLSLFVSFYFQLRARHGITKAFSLKGGIKDHFYILTHNNILKYLPGGIWNQLDAALMLQKGNNVSVVRTGKLVFIEMYWRVVWGYVFFGWLVQRHIRYELFGFEYVGALSHYFLAVAFLFLTTFIVSKRHPGIYLYSLKNFLDQAFSNFVFWLIGGIEFALLTFAFSTITINVQTISYLTGASVVSWVVGFLVLPAPSGLGVREYLLGIFFAALPGGGGIVAGVSLSLMQRLFILMRDIVVFLFAFALRRRT